jgi:enoyl-CoA hydratase/carnithine racemase
MPKLDDYAHRYSRAELRREGGVLEIKLHNGKGESLVWDEPAHRELPDLFADVANDSDNRVVILTGTGDSFCDSVAFGDWPPLTATTWDKIFTEGRRLLTNLLGIEVPVIGVVNGAARYHAELLILSDIVLCADHAVFQDAPHFPNAVPADGVHTVWPHLLGPNRGRYFLLTNEEIGAAEAKALDMVAEVMPKGDLLDRAWELARDMDTRNPLLLKYTRLALTAQLKRAVLTDLPFGLTLEGLAGISSMP